MFEVQAQNEGEATILTVRGEVDMQVAPELWASMEKAIDGGGALKVSLSGVSYIDSSGIATLIRGLKYAQSRRLDYTLLSPSERVRKVLELAQLDKLFSIEAED